jgi:hypothetical protein
MPNRTLREILETRTAWKLTPTVLQLLRDAVRAWVSEEVAASKEILMEESASTARQALNALEALANAPAPDVSAELLAALKPVYDAAESLPGGETASLFDETWNPDSHFPALTLTVQEMRNIVSAVQRAEASQQPSEQHNHSMKEMQS